MCVANGYRRSRGWWAQPHPSSLGGGARTGLFGSARLPEIQEQPSDRLCVLQLVELLLELVLVPAHDLDVFVVLGTRFACFDVLGEENVHPLVTKTGRRVER